MMRVVPRMPMRPKAFSCRPAAMPSILRRPNHTSVTLVWLGRRKIEGIAAGRQLKAFGRIGMRGTTRIIYNPRYELDA